MITSSAVAAVVVLYHPDAEVPDNIGSYAAGVERLYIVDNSEAVASDVIRAIRQRFGHAHIIGNGANLGIARALNIGAQAALAEGFAWLLTMDQDSRATPGMVTGLVRCAEGYPQGPLGIVAPYYLDKNTSASPTDDGRQWYELPSVITSGNLLSLEAYRQAGPFDDKLFIDYVDHEYCLRLRKKGFRIVQTRTAVLHHRQGAIANRVVLGRNVFFSNHNPTRRYYITRNRLYVINKYGHDFPDFRRNDLLGSAKELIKIICFEGEKIKKLKNIWKGYAHFKQQRFGKL